MDSTESADRLRRSPRCREIDYAAQGEWFVTFVTRDRACLLGEVRDGAIRRTAAGDCVHAAGVRLGSVLPGLRVDAFVVMPNHVHAILVIDAPRPGLSVPGAVGAWKAMATSCIRRRTGDADAVVWQRSFHDRLIRDEREWAALEWYIASNPARWVEDCLNPAGEGAAAS